MARRGAPPPVVGTLRTEPTILVVPIKPSPPTPTKATKSSSAPAPDYSHHLVSQEDQLCASCTRQHRGRVTAASRAPRAASISSRTFFSASDTLDMASAVFFLDLKGKVCFELESTTPIPPCAADACGGRICSRCSRGSIAGTSPCRRSRSSRSSSAKPKKSHPRYRHVSPTRESTSAHQSPPRCRPGRRWIIKKS